MAENSHSRIRATLDQYAGCQRVVFDSAEVRDLLRERDQLAAGGPPCMSRDDFDHWVKGVADKAYEAGVTAGLLRAEVLERLPAPVPS